MRGDCWRRDGGGMDDGWKIGRILIEDWEGRLEDMVQVMTEGANL